MALLTTVLFVLLSISCGFAKSVDKISNGNEVAQGKYPQTVSLLYNSEHTCGATILNENWVLTAAGCINGPSFYRYASIYSGSVDLNSGGVRHSTPEIIVHEGFSFFPNLVNDIALIKVDPPFDFSNDTKEAPVVLPERNFDAEEGTEAFVLGWGQPTVNLPSVDILREASIRVISDASCSSLPVDAATTMCAKSAAAATGHCYGDNGGPLLAEGVQVGIVSWGVACGGQNQPAVFTQVSAYVDWIQSKIN